MRPTVGEDARTGGTGLSVMGGPGWLCLHHYERRLWRW